MKENTIPEVNAYLETVREEIKEKSIQESILLELYQHMEDSASLQVENGVPVNDAWHYALSTMGDARETGRQLNLVHQKRSPLLPLAITGISVFIALVTGFSINYQKRTVIGLITACVIIILLTYFGHNILKRKRLICIISAVMFSLSIILRSHTLLFAFCMFWTLILAYIEIKPQKYTSYISIIVYAIVIWLCRYPYGTYTLTSALILSISFSCSIIHSKQNNLKSKCIKLLSVITIFIFVYLPCICIRLETYISSFSNESMLIFSTLKNVHFIGKAFFFDNFINGLSGHYVNYRILYWVLSYGIFPTSLILFMICGMYIVLFCCIKRLSNHNHQVLAISCFSCLLIQFILYLLGNFGLLFLCFPALPLLSEGISSIIINASFIGIILNLYRHDRILSIV